MRVSAAGVARRMRDEAIWLGALAALDIVGGEAGIEVLTVFSGALLFAFAIGRWRRAGRVTVADHYEVDTIN